MSGRNHVRTALSDVRRDHGYAAVSIVGLAAGIACCPLIFLYFRSEFDVNFNHQDG